MTVTYQHDRCTLHQGDSLAVLNTLDDNTVDAVITDPPYSSGGQFRGDRTAGTASKYVQTGSANTDLPDFLGDNRDARSYAYWCALWLSETLRITRPGGVCALFTDWRQLPSTTDALQAGGWIWRGIVPWHKPNGRPTQGRWSNTCEYVVWGTAGPRELDGPPLPGFYQANSPRDREHQTQKPLDVMRALTNITQPADTILDPFMGSGTTGVAAILEGRRFVGIEQHAHYVNVAERRIREALLEDDESEGGQLSMFAGAA